jgi:trk system potassium uptake protein TrkA
MPGKFGIDHVVVQPEICSRKVLNILDNPAILDKILFSAPEALMTAVRIFPSSPLAGVKLREFPRSDLVREVRFALAIRQERTFAPNGETVFVAGDEVYVSGSRECVGKMVDWISSPSPRLSRIVVAGGTRLGAGLVRELSELGYPVRLIEENYERSERILDELRARVMVINGDPNEQDILLEAGVTDECDLFVATQDDDENNILSGILAKGMGAKKVVVFTNKPEYIDIMRGIRSIDCGFSRRLVAVNTILRNLASGTVRTEALLHRAKASVIEFEIRPDSPLCNSPIDACRFPDSTVLAFVYRDGSVIPPVGNLVLLSGDLVATVATVANSRNLEAFFKSRTLLSS